MRPILEYGCIVWDPFSKKNIKRFEKLQNTALRFIFKLKGQVSFTEIKENTGIESLAKRRKDLRFKYYLNAVDKNLTVPDFGGFKKCHNTRQQGAYLYLPSGQMHFFYSFCPRKSRDFRDLC